MSPAHRDVFLNSPDATAAFAGHFVPFARPGNTLLLSGEIGAGKTHFARSLIRLLDPGAFEVPSPTFTLVQVYDGPGTEVWHADLYRLTSPDDCVELGLTEAFDTAFCLVEWPDRLGDAAPDNALTLDFAPLEDPDARKLTLRWTDPRWDGIADAT